MPNPPHANALNDVQGLPGATPSPPPPQRVPVRTAKGAAAAAADQLSSEPVSLVPGDWVSNFLPEIPTNPAYPRIPGQPLNPPQVTLAQMGRGAATGLGETVASLTTPQNLTMAAMTGGLPKFIQSLVALGFGADMALHLYQNAPSIQREVDSGDPERAAHSATLALSQMGIASGAVAHGVAGVGREVLPSELPQQLMSSLRQLPAEEGGFVHVFGQAPPEPEVAAGHAKAADYFRQTGQPEAAFYHKGEAERYGSARPMTHVSEPVTTLPRPGSEGTYTIGGTYGVEGHIKPTEHPGQGFEAHIPIFSKGDTIRLDVGPNVVPRLVKGKSVPTWQPPDKQDLDYIERLRVANPGIPMEITVHQPLADGTLAATTHRVNPGQTIDSAKQFADIHNLMRQPEFWRPAPSGERPMAPSKLRKPADQDEVTRRALREATGSAIDTQRRLQAQLDIIAKSKIDATQPIKTKYIDQPTGRPVYEEEPPPVVAKMPEDVQRVTGIPTTPPAPAATPTEPTLAKPTAATAPPAAKAPSPAAGGHESLLAEMQMIQQQITAMQALGSMGFKPDPAHIQALGTRAMQLFQMMQSGQTPAPVAASKTPKAKAPKTKAEAPAAAAPTPVVEKPTQAAAAPTQTPPAAPAKFFKVRYDSGATLPTNLDAPGVVTPHVNAKGEPIVSRTTGQPIYKVTTKDAKGREHVTYRDGQTLDRWRAEAEPARDLNAEYRALQGKITAAEAALKADPKNADLKSKLFKLREKASGIVKKGNVETRKGMDTAVAPSTAPIRNVGDMMQAVEASKKGGQLVRVTRRGGPGQKTTHGILIDSGVDTRGNPTVQFLPDAALTNLPRDVSAADFKLKSLQDAAVWVGAKDVLETGPQSAPVEIPRHGTRYFSQGRGVTIPKPPVNWELGRRVAAPDGGFGREVGTTFSSADPKLAKAVFGNMPPEEATALRTQLEQSGYPQVSVVYLENGETRMYLSSELKDAPAATGSSGKVASTTPPPEATITEQKGGIRPEAEQVAVGGTPLVKPVHEGLPNLPETGAKKLPTEEELKGTAQKPEQLYRGQAKESREQAGGPIVAKPGAEPPVAGAGDQVAARSAADVALDKLRSDVANIQAALTIAKGQHKLALQLELDGKMAKLKKLEARGKPSTAPAIPPKP